MVPKIGESEARFWDLLLKAAGGIGAIITIVFGLNTLKQQGEQLKLQQNQM